MTPLKWAAGAVVLGSIALAVIFTARFGNDPGLVDSPLLGQRAPDVSLPRLDGEGDVQLADLEGEVVVVNFFASWCLPCREEQPHLVAAANAFAGRGVRFVSVAFRNQPADVAVFLDEYGNSPHAFYVTDPESRGALAFGVFGIPETFVIAADGRVAAKIIGAVDALTLGTTIDAVAAGETPGQLVVGETFSGPGG
ncbi:MAG TPA: redoxin domain-containing protein [Acidimicrobiia bacterium]|nr:redoxin domain-containing protein [Acidimicrobiia bacterium]